MTILNDKYSEQKQPFKVQRRPGHRNKSHQTYQRATPYPPTRPIPLPTTCGLAPPPNIPPTPKNNHQSYDALQQAGLPIQHPPTIPPTPTNYQTTLLTPTNPSSLSNQQTTNRATTPCSRRAWRLWRPSSPLPISPGCWCVYICV